MFDYYLDTSGMTVEDAIAMLKKDGFKPINSRNYTWVRPMPKILIAIQCILPLTLMLITIACVVAVIAVFVTVFQDILIPHLMASIFVTIPVGIFCGRLSIIRFRQVDTEQRYHLEMLNPFDKYKA